MREHVNTFKNECGVVLPPKLFLVLYFYWLNLTDIYFCNKFRGTDFWTLQKLFKDDDIVARRKEGGGVSPSPPKKCDVILHKNSSIHGQPNLFCTGYKQISIFFCPLVNLGQKILVLRENCKNSCINRAHVDWQIEKTCRELSKA